MKIKDVTVALFGMTILIYISIYLIRVGRFRKTASLFKTRAKAVLRFCLAKVFISDVQEIFLVIKENVKSFKSVILNFTLSHEKLISKMLRSLKGSGSLSYEHCKKIKAVRSKPGILQGAWKIPKFVVDICPPLTPILSKIGTAAPSL